MSQSPSMPETPAHPSQRVETLLSRMTLEEKIGQMVQSGIWPDSDVPELIRAGRVGSVLTIHGPAEINALQRIAVEESRLGIPLIIANDVLHGYRTTFPIPLAMACTWDPALVEQVARVVSIEAAAGGTCWNFSPMVDICRDPRWGRVAEGAGEDPLLGAHMAAAWVRGFQSGDLPGGRGMAACIKHYAAYGGAEAGKDYNTVDMSERRLRGEYLPPYRSAVQAGAMTLMTSFNEVNGVPATANPFLLRTLLRGEWGFDGVVISDFDAIAELVWHGFSRDLRDAALQSVKAGVDIDMMGNAYPAHLAELVREGWIAESLVDESARRVLILKERLGLLDTPYIDEGLAEQYFLRPEHSALALRAAEESMVLLKNEGGLLPLDGRGKKIALVGPLAENRSDWLGSWACVGRGEDVQTLRECLQALLPAGDGLLCAPGCSIDGDDLDLDAVRQVIDPADVVILALGEAESMSGEAHSRANIGLPGRQQELLEAAAALGKPVVVVLVTGRPLAIRWLADHVGAILLAWQGGTEGPHAAARLLLGMAEPAGRLTISFPVCEGQIPVYYAHKSTGRPQDSEGIKQFTQYFRTGYIDEPNEPLFPFGYGLSYTPCVYRDLQVETPRISVDGTLRVSVEVTNPGARAGSETVQCYVRDLVGSVTRPVKELKAYQKVLLQPGETRRVFFDIPASELAFWDANMRYRVEPGDFQVWVGPDSASGLWAPFEVVETAE